MTTTAERSANVDAPPEVIAALLADFAALATWTSAVDHSSALTAASAGIGAARRVQIGRVAIIEKVVDWDLPRTIAYRIEGLPAALGEVVNRWTVVPKGERSSEVTLTTTVTAAARVGGRVIEKAATTRMAKTSDQLLADLAGHLSGKATP